MKISFSEKGWDDYQWWVGSGGKALKRLRMVIEDVLRNGYSGIGKPEPLKGDMSGWWSRRIDDKHRLVYRIDNDTVEINKCKDHY